MVKIKKYVQLGTLITIFLCNLSYASFQVKSSSGNITFTTSVPPKTSRIERPSSTSHHSSIAPIATFKSESAPSASLSLGITRPSVARTASFETQVSQGIPQIKSNLANAIKEMPKKIADTVAKHAKQMEGLPSSVIESSTKTLEQALSKFKNDLDKRQLSRKMLLQEMGLSPFTSSSLDSCDIHELDYEWQCDYLRNELKLQNIAYSINVLEKCIYHNKQIVRSVKGEISKTETTLKTQTPMSQLSPVIEQEKDKIQKFIGKGEGILRDQDGIAKLQPEIDKRNHWYTFWEWKKLHSLEHQKEVLTKSIRSGLSSLAQSSVKELEQSMSHCSQELSRFNEFSDYTKQCEQEYLQLQNMSDDLVRKGVVSSEENQKIFGAVKQIIPATKVISELTPDGRAVLKQYGYNPDEIQTKMGTPLQKELSNQLCEIINRSGKTFVEHRDELVQEYIGTTIDCCNVAYHVIDKGTPHQAIAWTKLSHAFEQATNIIIGMAKGVMHGLKDGAQFYLNARFNPTYLVQQLVEVGTFCIHAYRGNTNVLQAIQKTCSLFAALPAEQQAEHAMAFLTMLLIPGPKVNAFTNMSKTLEKMRSIMKKEAAALEHLYKIEKATAVIIKEVAVPERWEKPINELIHIGKITTTEDVIRWVEHFEAPLTSGVNKAAMELASTFSQAAQKSKGYAIRQKMAQFASEAEAKAEHAAATQGFKSVADTAGKTIGKIDHLPAKCPVSKDLYNHLFRIWVNKRGNLVGGHMPRKQPGLISRTISGPNSHGIKEVILKKDKFESLPKTVGPDSWNQIDYSRYLKQAYDNITEKESHREGVLKLTGIDKNGISWRMYLELKDGIYKLTTGFPLL